MLELHPASVKQDKKDRRKFYVLLSLLLSGCFMQYVVGLYIPQVILLAIAFLIVITGDSDVITAMCMCCIPLHTFFEFSFVVLFSIICYVIKNGNKIRLYNGIIPVVLMILWELLHCFIPNLNVMQFGGHCVTWILLAVLMCNSRQQLDYGFVVRAFVFTTGAICCLLIGKIIYAAGLNLSALFINLQRLGVESEDSTTKVNPNTLGILCLLGVTGLLQLRFAGHREKRDIYFIVALLLFGVMTASKTFFVCLVFTAMLFLFSVKGHAEQKIRYVANVLVIAIIVLFICYIAMPELLSYYVGRFFEKDFTTGRIDTMGEYHKFLISNWDVLFLGIGLQGFSARVLQLCPQAVFVPHNGIQELLLAWGVPGLFLFAGIWYAMFVRSKKQCRQQGLINFIPFLVLLLKIQAGQMLNSSYTMLSFSFAYLSMCANLSKSDEQQPEKIRCIKNAPIDDKGIDLWRAVQVLWKKWLAIAAMAIAGAFIAFGVTKGFVAPKYKSSILLYINNSNVSAASIAEAISNGDIAASRSLVDTHSAILRSRKTINDVIALSGVQRTYEEVNGMIMAYSVEDTEVLKVVVENTDPAEAQKIANAIAQVLPVRTAEIIDGTSTSVIDYAVVAETPSSPSKATNTMIGGVIGFVVGAMLLLLQAMRDTKIKEEDLTALFPYPVLAAIPKLADKGAHSTREKF